MHTPAGEVEELDNRWRERTDRVTRSRYTEEMQGIVFPVAKALVRKLAAKHGVIRYDAALRAIVVLKTYAACLERRADPGAAGTFASGVDTVGTGSLGAP